MITPLDFLFDLFNPSLAFLPRALAAVTLASLVTGVVGCHVMSARHGFYWRCGCPLGVSRLGVAFLSAQLVFGA